MAAELSQPDEETALYLLPPSPGKNRLSPDLILLQEEADSYRRTHNDLHKSPVNVTTRRMMAVVACHVEDASGRMQEMVSVPVLEVFETAQALWELPVGIADLLVIELKRSVKKRGGIAPYLRETVFGFAPPKPIK